MQSVNHRFHALPVALALVLLLIVYGSLYPFRWNFSDPQAFIWSGRIGLVDLVENIVLFLPLGGLLGWAGQGRPRKWVFFAAWLVVSLAVASALQWLQKYLPRTPALSDVVFNMAGFVLGWGAGFVARWRAGHLLGRHHGWADADRYTLVLIALWWVAELYPLIPTLDVSSVAQNVKSLWQQNLWQPRRMLLHGGMAVIGLSAVAQLARTAHLAHRARTWALVAALVVLTGKFVVVGQSPGTAVVLGIGGGWLLWRWLDTWAPGARWAATAWVALATYLLDAIWPWAWRTPPADMAWMPFASSLSTWVQSAVTARAFECLCFGAMLWSTVRNGALVGGMTICTAVLALACEWTQRYLPTRTAEITSVLLAIGMGWLLSVCTTVRKPRKLDA
ncbi:MAG: VanZ family protein [Comamonadaceae bacterium]|jgi:VanZ family protein|nr:VanZ family protein [Comamonadaceae bacterium]